jgi:hypothetical protein
MIKLRRMRWAGHVAGMRNLYVTGGKTRSKEITGKER